MKISSCLTTTVFSRLRSRRILARISQMKKRVALVGYGYWGPNLLRNLFDHEDVEVVYCCDLTSASLAAAKKRYPRLKLTQDFNVLLKDRELDAIVLATPTKTHFDLARQAIEAGKDVLIEKPMVASYSQAQRLVALAKKHKRIVMVDHTFLFNDAVVKIKKLLKSPDFGDILYIDSVRINLGLFQSDINVIFDLASHDFSIINYLLDAQPVSVYAQAKTHFGQWEDVAYVTAEYPKNVFAHVHLSWLSPLKVRRMLIVGTKKMILYDDIESAEKVRLYDKGVVLRGRLAKNAEQVKIGYRSGDVWLPKIDIGEPLSILVREFIQATKTRRLPKSNVEFGATVIDILEKATKSARTGKEIKLRYGSR